MLKTIGSGALIALLLAPAAAEAADGGPARDVTPLSSDGAAPPRWMPKLTASVKPAVVALGDPVTVTITVRCQRDVSVTLPLQLELGPFTELSRRESSKTLEGGEQQRTFVLRLAVYDLGEQTLPPIEVTALGPGGELVSLKTAAVPLRVRSLMANEPKPELKDIAGPVAVFERDWTLLYLMVGLGTSALIVIATLLINRRLQRRRLAAKPAPPPTPPHVTALIALGALDLDGLIAEERFKELYLRLSEIIRAYLGGRWRFDALEMTTTEINEALARRAVAAEVRGRLEQYFDACDLVKFAKYRPDADGAREAAREAEAIVRATMQTVPTAGEGAAAVAAARAPRPAGAAQRAPDRISRTLLVVGLLVALEMVATGLLVIGLLSGLLAPPPGLLVLMFIVGLTGGILVARALKRQVRR